MYGTLISSVTVGAGGASSIDFTSIPGTYTDLVIVLSARATTGNTDINVSINGGATTPSTRVLYGTGSVVGTASSWGQIAGIANPNTYTANTFSNCVLTFPNYAGSTNKSYSLDAVNENNATAATQEIIAGSWASTSAITTISLTLGNFAQYSTAYLYGLTKGSGGATVS